MLIILYSTNYMLTTLSLSSLCQFKQRLTKFGQRLSTDLCGPFPSSATSEVYTSFHILQPTHLLPYFRHLCLHLHHHTPMENLRRYFSHTNALLLDAHDQKIWCNMFRTIHTTMADFDGPTVLPYPLSLQYSSSDTTFSLYLNTHEFDRGR